MSDGERSLRFYFDYISSNAYLAWERIFELAARFERTVEPVPVLFAGLLEAHGQLGPAEILPKALWMAKNNLRKAIALGLPLRRPAFHPFNPLLALRVSSLPLPEADRRRLIGALFRATWARELHVSEPDVVVAIADEIGLDGKALVAQAQSPESKSRLRRQTDDAIAVGVFGVPSMRVDGELFWGYDDFSYLELFLAGKDPIGPDTMSRWIGGRPQASAMRRRFRDPQSAG